MARLFLAWTTALAIASWLGVTLAELEAFSPWPPLVAAALAFVACVLLLRGGGAGWLPERAAALPVVALLLGATLWPVVDTTLLSQDASVHRASGRWLARTGSLAIPDDTFAALDEDGRLKLFGGASVSPSRVSLTRLPGGIVLPDTHGHVAYPSFSHLLAVWIAIADGIGGPGAIDLVGPLFAVTAWWAVGLVALLDAGLLAALAAPLLLAALFPEHWFARFLMPEILAQALVWSGVAAARLAVRAEELGAEHGRARWVAAAACGLLLGVAGFARLELFWVFVPALLVARALTRGDHRLLPRGALPVFVVVALHAVLHLFVVPTDYANRIFKQVVGATFPLVVFINDLTGQNGPLTLFLIFYVIPALLLAGGVAFLWFATRVERRRPGFRVRASAALVGLPWLALIYRHGLPEHFPALRSLALYVPWPTWLAVGLGALRLPRWTGLDLALLLLALDQVVHARVTDLQPWASRRLVTVVLPLVVLAAVRALASDRARARFDEQGEGTVHGSTTVTVPPAAGPLVRPALERRVAAALIALATVVAALRLAPVVGRELQSGGRALAARVAEALPDANRAYVILAQPLDWVHLAAALWLGEGPMTLVAREQPWFEGALHSFLAQPLDRPLYVLAGEVAPPGAAPDPSAAVPPLPDALELEPIEDFAWRTSFLATATERRPSELEERSLAMRLYRVVPPSSTPDGSTAAAP
ncbi:MAG TPA: hypothetical protein VIS07_06595 [Candidatus Binatia bacterium]